jgi:hypothetical protein
MMARLRTESLAKGGVPQLDRVVAHLSKAAGVAGITSNPVVPVILRLDGQRLALFSTIAQFGTPEDLTLEDFKIELYFPLDQAAETLLRGMAGA